MSELTSDRIQYYTQIAVEASRQGSEILLDHWGKLKQIKEKSTAGDLVTEADQLSEECVLKFLRKECPDHTIISEESGLHNVEGSDFTWAVDPLDGTTNYAHQIPIFAVSIALIYRGNPVVGVVYNPFVDELFVAGKDQGAFLNGQKLSVSNVDTMGKSILATGFAYDRRDTPDNNYAEFCYLTSQTQGVRRMGSAALDLAYVASGRFDGFWERGLNVWDIAAGTVLVREAGGVVSSYENGPLELKSGRILATNGLIHVETSKTLQKVHDNIPPILFS
ncbi:MAG: inositol monophosphatase family protein [Chlamydiota bacterium]